MTRPRMTAAMKRRLARERRLFLEHWRPQDVLMYDYGLNPRLPKGESDAEPTTRRVGMGKRRARGRAQRRR